MTGSEKEAKAPTNPIAKMGEKVFKVYERKSTWLAEFRAGCVLFMTSAYILFLNPLILSGASSGSSTGMPATDVVLATAISTGLATMTLGLTANYPWVVSTQLGTNTYFVNEVLKPNTPCGAHSQMVGDRTDPCSGLPCSCIKGPGGNVTFDVIAKGLCAANTTATCLGTKIAYEKALAATFLEGLVFFIICITGLRVYILRLIPKTVLMAGAAGIGLFIAFVGAKDMGVIVQAPYPTLLQLNTALPYSISGKPPGLGFNDCVIYMGGPPFGPVCPWLSVAGLIFTGILLVWNINGAFIAGIFFTMFISWIKFPDKISAGGLVPDKVVDVPKFLKTAGALDFNWGEDAGALTSAFFLFLYLDFVGSSITFMSLGQMAGLINEKGDMPRSNIAFVADAVGSMIGGLLGSSALTTYVESAAAMREGGRTGFTAVVCSLFFFASCFLYPLFSNIPFIATGPVLVLIGVLIFMSAVTEINWADLTDAAPAFITIIGMPFTHNIAYGIIGGAIMYVVTKFFTMQLFDFQKSWPGVATYKSWSAERSMFVPVPGWNVDAQGERMDKVCTDDQDLSMLTFIKRKDAKGPSPFSGNGTDVTLKGDTGV